MKRALRTALRVAAALGVLLAVLGVRVVTGSRAELERGDALSRSGEIDAAILAYRRSARLEAPGNPYSRAALGRLATIGAGAEKEGDKAQALAAYRSIRGAILSAESFHRPHRATLAEADRRIAALTHPEPEARRAALETLEAPSRPHLGFTLLLLAGWLAWTLGAFAFAQRAVDEEGRIALPAARLWGTVVVVGFGLFVIGMALA